MPKSTCSFEGCNRDSSAKGLCGAHRRQQIKGEPLRPIRRKVHTDAPIAERLSGTYSVNQSTGCWEWSMSTNTGYGELRIHGMTYKAHRLSYEAHVGPIPDGMFLDHICGVRHCINPDHLRPVTNKQNMENMTVLDSRTVSGYRGVSYDAIRDKWRAYVNHEGRQYSLGRFDSAEEANEAAVAKRIELYTHNDRDRAV